MIEHDWKEAASPCPFEARQLMAHYRGRHEPVTFQPPPWCRDNAPGEANCYTDGSLQHQGRFSLAGAAVWWPGCQETAPIAQLESHLSVSEHLDEPLGRRQVVHLPGLGSSSTRAELAAGLIALAHTGPVHMATDSQSFMDKATAVQGVALAGTQPKRAWLSQRDGDLWAMYHTFLTHKTLRQFVLQRSKHMQT